MRVTSLFLAVVALAAVVAVSADAPFHKASPGKSIPGAFIVSTSDHAASRALGNGLQKKMDDIKAAKGNGPDFLPPGIAVKIAALQTYDTVFTGFSLRFDVESEDGSAPSDEKKNNAWKAAVNQLRRLDGVQYVEEDATVSINVDTVQTVGAGLWGLDRIDQHALPTDSKYNQDSDGTGVEVHVLDTGVWGSHDSFKDSLGNSRVSYGYTGYGTNVDGNGHGTHCAGTIASNDYGVAKKAKIVASKVLSDAGSGSYSTIIAGLDWVGKNAKKPAAASMSLGGGASTALDSAIATLVGLGVPIAVAAGNDNANACNYSPARAPSAITVMASTNTDARASFSNFGTCCDIIAPGYNILSTWTGFSTGSNTGTNTISGTSMATPHVAGVIALYLSAFPTNTPAQVAADLITLSSKDRITSVGTGSPNRLLYSKVKELSNPPPPVVGDSKTDQCNAGGCVNPGPLTFTSSAAQAFEFTISALAPLRGWLTYTVSGTGKKKTAAKVELQYRATSGASWSTKASDTNADGDQSIKFTATTTTGFYRWLVTPTGATPMSATFVYKITA